MLRDHFQSLLKNYNPLDTAEKEFLDKMQIFVAENSNCFERSNVLGHVTGSAFIVNQQLTHSLMVHHKKLNKWLQPGGHCDGDSDVARVAQNEAVEETGITNFTIENNVLFDIDIHEIPERKGVPAHLHYDARFLIVADDRQKLFVSNESNELKWVKMDEIEKYNNEKSIIRMVRKVVK